MNVKTVFADIPNNKNIILDGNYHCSGEAELQSIVVSRIGKRYRCDLEIKGKYNIKYIKKIEVIEDIDRCYNGMWKDQIRYSINEFKEKESHEQEKELVQQRSLLDARLASQAQYRSCEGKKAYRTPEYADKIYNQMTKKYQEEFNYYFCHFCACYHIGHVPFWTKTSSIA